MAKIDKLKNKIFGALADPNAPWYGSDLVSWVGDYIEETEKRIVKLEAALEKIRIIPRNFKSGMTYAKRLESMIDTAEQALKNRT